MRIRRSKLSVICAMLLLAACGGGDNHVADGAIGGTGIVASGPIAGFGSVFVNGIEFRTSAATQITVNGSANRAQSDLGLGFAVTARGVLNANQVSASVSNIDYGSNLRGPVDAVDVSAGTISVLAQTVRVAAGTVFSNLSALAELSAGDMLEVSGLVDAEGRIVATYVERQSPFVPGVSTLRVRGTIGDLTPRTFSIGKLVIDYSMVLPQNLAVGTLSNGSAVEVTSNRLPQSGVLSVTNVSSIDPSLGAREGDQVIVQGLVSGSASAAGFTLAGVPVSLGPGTVFENGSAAALARDAKVQVRGQWRGGQVVASKVSFI
jgi:Domain of unknown function (DUF5666)